MSVERRYAILPGLVPGEWLVGDADTIRQSAQVVYSREAAFEAVAHAEANRLAGADWSFAADASHVRAIRSTGEWHEFRDRGEGRPTVWQEVALFLALWRDTHRGRVPVVSEPEVVLPAIWAVA